MSQILDRLYYQGQETAALQWLWENKSELFTPGKLHDAVWTAAYVAKYASERFLVDADDIQPMASSVNDEEFITTAQNLCESLDVSTDVQVAQGLDGGIVAKLLVELAKKLLEEWLKSQ